MYICMFVHQRGGECGIENEFSWHTYKIYFEKEIFSSSWNSSNFVILHFHNIQQKPGTHMAVLTFSAVH